MIETIKKQDWFKSIFKKWEKRDYKLVFLLYPLGFWALNLILQITRIDTILGVMTVEELEVNFVGYFTIVIIFLFLHYFFRVINYIMKLELKDIENG